MCDIFMAFAKHEQEKEDIINMIISHYHTTSELEFSINLSGYDEMSESDLEYIQKEVIKRV